jgi:hypothetical protein
MVLKTLGYLTDTLNHIFFLHQDQNIFFSNIGNQNICLEKNHNPPPFKLNGCSLTNKGEHSIIIIIQCKEKIRCVIFFLSCVGESKRHKGSNTGKRARRKYLRHQRESFLVSNEAPPSWRPIDICPVGV